jgi:carbamate kinase
MRRMGDHVEGIEAVIDKDRTAALIARSVRAAGFVILTGVPRAYRRFGSDEEEPIPAMGIDEARTLLAGGEFPAGSMGPKIEAACEYAEHTGRPGLITDAGSLGAAIRGESGTWIHP